VRTGRAGLPRKAALLAAAVASIVATGAVADYDVPRYAVAIESDVVYGLGAVQNGARAIPLLLDLYEPLDTTEPARPMVVLVHGGGFQAGSKTMSQFVGWARHLATRGYVVASIDYRIATQHPPADPAYSFRGDGRDAAAHAGHVDTKRAIRWARAFAVARGIDPSRIFVGGGSAGAVHALAGLSDEDEFLTDFPGQPVSGANHPGFSSRVAGIVDFWGGFFGDYVDAGDPALLIVHGTLDPSYDFFEFAVPLALTAEAFGVPLEFHPLPGLGHAAWGVPIDGLSAFDLSVRFLHPLATRDGGALSEAVGP